MAITYVTLSQNKLEESVRQIDANERNEPPPTCPASYNWPKNMYIPHTSVDFEVLAVLVED